MKLGLKHLSQEDIDAINNAEYDLKLMYNAAVRKMLESKESWDIEMPEYDAHIKAYFTLNNKDLIVCYDFGNGKEQYSNINNLEYAEVQALYYDILSRMEND